MNSMDGLPQLLPFGFALLAIYVFIKLVWVERAYGDRNRLWISTSIAMLVLSLLMLLSIHW